MEILTERVITALKEAPDCGHAFAELYPTPRTPYADCYSQPKVLNSLITTTPESPYREHVLDPFGVSEYHDQRVFTPGNSKPQMPWLLINELARSQSYAQIMTLGREHVLTLAWLYLNWETFACRALDSDARSYLEYEFMKKLEDPIRSAATKVGMEKTLYSYYVVIGGQTKAEILRPKAKELLKAGPDGVEAIYQIEFSKFRYEYARKWYEREGLIFRSRYGMIRRLLTAFTDRILRHC